MEFEKPKPVTYADPAKPGNLSSTNLLPWQRTVDPSTHEEIGKAINSAETIQSSNEGLKAAEDASNAIMNSVKLPGMSQALSARAGKKFLLGQSSNRQSLNAQNVTRQQRELRRLGTQMQNIEQLKKINAEGQLRYADQIAEYNNNLEMAKYQTLSNILGGAGSFYGGALGGNMMKGAKAQEPKKASNGMERANAGDDIYGSLA